MIIILSINSIILLTNNNEKRIEKIRKETQVTDVEMTEDGILIQLNIDNELNYYYYECK
jgi:hypothetical protein